MAVRGKSSKADPAAPASVASPSMTSGGRQEVAGKSPAAQPTAPADKQRDRERTRGLLLKAAFEEIWSRGYSATSVDEIIAKTGFTKGAFYHHFGSKKQLALAVLEEIIGGMTRSRWVDPYAGLDDPLTPFITWLRDYHNSDCAYDVSHGCPLNNISQELSNVDSDFQRETAALFELWIDSIAEMIARSSANGYARRDVDAKRTAVFFIAAFEGGISLAKSMHRPAPLQSVLGSLISMLEELQTKPESAGPRKRRATKKEK
jgi:TetR/AcrR family transcriptional repressor of nem operon